MYDYDLLIIGAGPAGIFTALEMNRLAPEKKVLVVDSGSSIDHRACPARTSGQCAHCKTCSIMNGWAGAGAFSDGKLSLSEEVGGNLTDYLPVDTVRQLIHYADEIYLQFGAPKKIYGKSDKFAEELAYEAHKENIQFFASRYFNAGDMYFIGRNVDYAASLEASLKLKEISYIHSEAYAAGELKHGPISLIEDGTLVIALATDGRLFDKMMSNIREVKARGAVVLGLATEDRTEIAGQTDMVFYIPKISPFMLPSLSVIPMQLFAYYVASMKGCDIDKPRNLAKSVTVE